MGNPGASPGRSESWWNRNGSSRSMDPNKIGSHGVKDQKAVEHYKKNPNSHYPGGGQTPVCVVRNPDGSYYAREGAHRVAAAKQTGRRVRVKVVDAAKERGQERKGKGASR